MPPSLRDLPQLSELLEHPTVQRALERVNQSTIAQQATGFLNELRAGAARAVEGVPTNVGDLAEAFVRRVLRERGHAEPLVNATGVVLGGVWDGVPLSEAAVHRVMVLASDYAMVDGAYVRSVEQAAAAAAGCEDALVFSSRAALEACCLAAGWDNFERAWIAGLVDPETHGLASVPTVAARLKDRADAVAVSGDGLLGGPACAVVFGRSSTLQGVREHEAYAAAAPNRVALAALEATLGLYQDRETLIHKLPVWSLLTTPRDNLRQRAERLAPLLAAIPGVAAAEPMEDISPWCKADGLHLEASTWCVRVESGTASVESAAARLERDERVAARQRSDALHLDLRAVFPRWDQRLVAATESGFG
ncbi:MAG: hypothetical protein AAGA92_14905 [Planctomycetota bacterium]